MGTNHVAFATAVATSLLVIATADAATRLPSSTYSTPGVSTSRFGIELEKAIGYADDLTKTELNSAIALSQVTSPAELVNAKVDDRAGMVIGWVKSMFGKSDTAIAVNIEVGGWLGIDKRILSIAATNFTYIPTRNILVADMSKTQIEELEPISITTHFTIAGMVTDPKKVPWVTNFPTPASPHNSETSLRGKVVRSRGRTAMSAFPRD